MLAPTKRKAILSIISEIQENDNTLSVTDCLNEMVIDKVITLKEANYLIDWLF